jgi:Beta-lactamase enzyme family
MRAAGLRRAIVGAVLVAVLLAPGQAGAAGPSRWGARVDAARTYAESRAGVVAFAVVDERGRLHGYRASAVAPSASVLKAMLLVAYLRKGSVRDRPLTDRERGLLGPMIRRSDNDAASTILGLVGRRGVMRLAAVTGMAHFRLVTPYWGHSQITPRDQAHYFHHIDRYVPSRHRHYAMHLLATIVPSQRWGIAKVAPEGWNLYFKGGWSSGTGLVDHQVALLRLGKARVSLCITTRFNPDHEYGKRTLRGVASRLVGGRWVAAPTVGPR